MKNQIQKINLIISACAIVMISLLQSTVSDGQPVGGLSLWYDQPAKDWMTEALPIGNGYMGAMFFGGVEKERI